MNELGNTPADKNYKPSGISKAEERAWERFPEQMTPLVYQDVIEAFGGKTEVDFNLLPRSYFQLGYEAAEKDTIERVCEWLSRHYDIDIVRFRKAMEEEQ